MRIRRARPEDAAAALDVIRRSIAELCIADHRNDPAILERWLANKTVENFSAWIANPDNHLFVASDRGRILAVGCVTSSGEITLNYVSPKNRFRGVSRALLQRLEAQARRIGHSVCRLTSTGTPRRFYASAGYVEQGPPMETFGSKSHPLAKSPRSLAAGSVVADKEG
jgi:GNAT superfamily N-acetyltransferase